MQVSSTVWFHFLADIASEGKSPAAVKTRWMTDVNPFDYHTWGVMLEHYKTFHPKPKNTDRLKNVLPQKSVNNAILSFIKMLSLCESWDGHFEHAFR